MLVHLVYILPGCAWEVSSLEAHILHGRNTNMDVNKGFRKYINGWYDDTNRRESKATTVHTQRVQVWIASHGWYNLEPGSVVRDSDQYRSIISFLLSGPSRQNEEGNLGQYFISACSDGRHSLGTEEGGPALLEKYPKCSSKFFVVLQG